ncbi:MAG: Fic family protein [Gammaproteobacteria bacterium]|nr:Fic family protein [Gammaproteobacteria bacterium]
MYIWQLENWPQFDWDETQLRPRLDRIRLLQGKLLGSTAVTGESIALEMEALIQNAIRTSEIEGENLDAASVRSSVARQLGINHAGFAGKATPEIDAMASLLIEATRNWQSPVTLARLHQWQALVFPGAPEITASLRDEQPMHVMSGRLDRPTIHFTAPPRAGLEQQLQTFLDWFNHPPANLDGLLRAGIAHLWLLTLHPFPDGNGRITRALTDRALAQCEQQSVRFYALSEAIMRQRNSYYLALEQAQKGSLNITQWLQWFLATLEDALELAQLRVERTLIKTRFWHRFRECTLNERQTKVLNRMLDNFGEEFTDGLSARHYRALAKTSPATATRDLADLVQKGCLLALPGGGRSSRYRVNQ